jgi:hypothetical protein
VLLRKILDGGHEDQALASRGGQKRHAENLARHAAGFHARPAATSRAVCPGRTAPGVVV